MKRFWFLFIDDFAEKSQFWMRCHKIYEEKKLSPTKYFLVFLIFTRCFRCIVMQYNRNPACRDVLPSKNFPRDDHLVPLPQIPPTPIKMVQWLFFVCFFSLNCLIHWDFRVWQALFWPSLSLARRALLAMLGSMDPWWTLEGHSMDPRWWYTNYEFMGCGWSPYPPPRYLPYPCHYLHSSYL